MAVVRRLEHSMRPPALHSSHGHICTNLVAYPLWVEVVDHAWPVVGQVISVTQLTEVPHSCSSGSTTRQRPHSVPSPPHKRHGVP